MHERVKKLKTIKQPEQRSDEWFLQRQGKVTASEVASCLYMTRRTCEEYVKEYNLGDTFRYSETKTCNPYSSRKAYITKKANDFGKRVRMPDNEFTLWGKKFEETATRYYCVVNNTEIHDFGLLPHPRLRWLAASPDGITNDGIMLEIKCPKRRKITGVPPLYYWCQCQLQLEVTGLDYCDFLECDILEVPKEEWVNYQTDKKGLLIECGGENFKYLPRVKMSDAEMESWAENSLEEGENICYYTILESSTVRIPRSTTWFNNVKEDIRETWQEFMNLVEELKDRPPEPPPPPKECLL
jgi:putative phage-type endonuclease